MTSEFETKKVSYRRKNEKGNNEKTGNTCTGIRGRRIKKVLSGERCQKINHKIDEFKDIFDANKL